MANSSPVVISSDQSTLPISAAALPLPTGASTSALQTTGNTSLSSIDTKTPALGQALAAASVPIVLTASQLTTLTPPAAITGFATSALQTTGNTSVASIDTKTPALGQALAASSVPVVLTASQLTTLTPPAAITGYALDATLTGGTQRNRITDGTNNAAVKAASTAAVATDPALVVAISPNNTVAVTGTFFQATQPVSGTVTTTPPSNASTNIAQINGVTPLMGNGVTGTGSLRITIASDNTAFSVNANAGTNLNTSALALETGGNLATIATRTPALGQALAAASVPVVLTAAQITTLTPPAAITGFALDATLTGGTQQTKITDGTNVATVKAASTAAVATDKAVVVAISPNNTIAATQSGTWNVGTVTTLTGITNALPAGTNLLGKVGIDQTTVGTTNGVSIAQIGATTVLTGNGTAGAGAQRVTIASDNTAFNVNATSKPATSGGLSVYHLISAATTNLQVPKASAGQLYGYTVSNTSAAYSYLCFHNSATTPTAGASIFFKIGIPAGGGANVNFDNGIAFSSGIAISTVTGSADTNTTAVALGDLIINLFYN